MKKSPKWFYIILVLIPLLLLLLLESGLRLFSYGKNLDQWVELTDGEIILNPDIGARYFTSTKNYPHSNHDAFDEVKSDSTIRVFVLGGSSAAGFPYSPCGAFSRYLRDRLELIYPENKIEVINLGITAVNTYTIADLVPGVIDRHPDLIIIYAGHNEYYGALGAGSLESIGSSPTLIHTYLYLNNFKIFQLLKNIIKTSASLFSSDNNKAAGSTLMARMAEEKSIPYESDTYKIGLEQFESNLDYILSSFADKNIPVAIGTLTSNIKDLSPFVSVSSGNFPEADSVFEYAKEELSNGDITIADSLFRAAKDLDGLRFRAPESFNGVIRKLSKKYDCTLVKVDSGFSAESENNIVGYDLMVDHLHPTLKGYQLMGKIFSDKIEQAGLIKQKESNRYSQKILDLVVKSNYAFSRLDSTVSEFTVANLLHDWPFVPERKSELIDLVTLNSKIDTLAYKVVKDNYNWEAAHQEAYKWYLSKNDLNNFSMEIKVLYSQYPFKLSYLSFAYEELLKRKDFDNAMYFLKRKYKIEPDEFTSKWIGNISLFNNNIGDAIIYLDKSLSFNKKDPQIYFNLSVAYLRMKQYDYALEIINKCLELDPDYPNAGAMKIQLEQIIKKPR